MSKAAINSAFDKLHKDFGVGTFRSDYLLRQSSDTDQNIIGVQENNSTYYLKKEYLDGLTQSELIQLDIDIDLIYIEAAKKRNLLFAEIEKFRNLDFHERKKFILSMLINKETDKRGQAFEVTSYAILRTYYQVRGFDLNRFSTIYSNDGGVDFSSQKAVYQVTTDLSNKKFEDDLSKAPLKKRVFVYKNAGSKFNLENFDNDLILDHINVNDLKDHLDYLLNKRPDKNSLMILDIIEQEFKREYLYYS